MADANVSQLEINGTTYDICDATARDSLSQYVLKAGDTITGIYSMKSTNFDRDGADLSSNANGNAHIVFTDNDGEDIGWVNPYRMTDGTQYTYLQAFNEKSDGTAVFSNLAVGVKKDGSATYRVSDPAAFRQAINVVNKAGDDFFQGETGVVAASPYISLISSTVDATLTNNGISSGIIYPAYIWKDKNSKIICRVEGTVNTNGAIGSYWYVRNYNTSGDMIGQKGIAMALHKNGTFTYTVDEPSAFRKAIQMDSFWTVSRVDASISKIYGSSVNVIAPTVSGYTFFCWIYFSTQGWVGAVYSANIISNPTTVWNTYNGSGTGTVNCYALYKRN